MSDLQDHLRENRRHRIESILAALPPSMDEWRPGQAVRWGHNDNRNKAFALANDAGGVYSPTCSECEADVYQWIMREWRKLNPKAA